MKLNGSVLAVVAAVLVIAVAGYPSFIPAEVSCPTGWNHDAADDTCNSLFPRNNHNFSLGVKETFKAATEFCARQGAELPTIYNISKLHYLNDLVGQKSGVSWWVGIRADPSVKAPPQNWIARQGRPEGFVFDWDLRQHQPGTQSCVIQHMRGDGKKIHGGRTKMVTRDCSERHSVVCTKPRIPAQVTAINHEEPGRLEAIWGRENKYEFWGPRLPHGLQLSMQTTTEGEFASKPHEVTHCSHVGRVNGDMEPVHVNVTVRTLHNRFCNGTCSQATVVFPDTWPFVRGAKYSFCFFVPVPWQTPVVPMEFNNELAGPNAYLEVVQKHEEFLRDVCLRRNQNLNMFYGSGKVDTEYNKVHPFYFNSKVERGQR